MADRRRILFGDFEEVTGDQERDLLICALRAIEQREGERRGWDRPPQLMAMIMPSVESAYMHIDVIPAQRWRGASPNPVDWLTSTAVRQPISPPDRSKGPIRFADSPGGFAALAFMSEAWTAPPESVGAEEQARRERGERTFASNPDRVEMRTLAAMDINGHLYNLSRLRGFEPELVVTDNAPLSDVGRLVQALQRLTTAAYEGVYKY